LSTLLGGATIELLAQAIEKQGDASSFSLVVPMQAQGSKTPLFCVHAVGGYSLAYMDLAKAISTEQPFYAIESLGLREGQRAQINVIEMASTYIEQIKATQAEGPYRLMGHSFGGLVAYEMTRQLLEQGEQVSHLTLIDTLTPDYQLQDGKPEKINYQEINKPLQQAMSQDLPISEEDFNVMSLDEQIETILDLFRQMPTDIDIKIIEQVLDVNRKNLTAGQTYQLHALSQAVPVKLYRAKQRPEKLNQIDAGWKRVLNDDLTVVEVDGDHLTMLDEKNVGQWIDDV
ncbi:MAG: hypothetical protein HN826_01730, partial [Methylococcales bacterium]|nr:hypothetical protein [Methylococcales bacterium]